jgi:AcrR family transcriptional regulator
MTVNNIRTTKAQDASRKKRNRLIHQALICMSINFGCYELETKFEELASECHVSTENFVAQFHDIEKLLKMIIERMELLFTRHVKNPVSISTLKNKQLISYFIRRVRHYFNLYPEAGYLFTLSFFSNIIMSKAYRYLKNYFELWRTTLFDALKKITTVSKAKIITETYLASLRGQLQLANIETVCTSNLHAEQCLASVIKCL